MSSLLAPRTYSIISTFSESVDLEKEADDVRRAVAIVALTAMGYFLLVGFRHWRNQYRIARELQEARIELRYLQEKLRQSSDGSSSMDEHGEIRIFMDGAFDLMHFGHMNAFRLAKSLGTHLVVGVNSDQSITECKGAPLMNDEERLAMVKSCKFVDEVVPECPYVMNQEYLDWVIKTYRIDYVVHGDDPCIVDGKDVYATAKESGKFRNIPRTEGVSTTDIMGRMLLLTKEHHMVQDTILGKQSRFLTTSRLLQLFSSSVSTPTKDMRTIYIDGAWDLFHPGHVAILKSAKARGDYLIVGIHSDAVVNRRRGMNLPLLNLHERVLSVLGCRHVDDILIDAPYHITKEMVSSLKIDEIVHGTITDDPNNRLDIEARYKYAKQAGIFEVLESPSGFKMERIVNRIQSNQNTFQAKFDRKMKAETEFYHEKYRGAQPDQ